MAGKKSFFQKSDRKKQYSDKVLNDVENAYRPKNRGRIRNPISSNTMSGEEPGSFDEPLVSAQETTQKTLFKNPVGYAFAGPQAKRQKPKIHGPQVETVSQEKLPELEFPARKKKNARKKTETDTVARTVKPRKLSEPEIKVRSGKFEIEVAFELLQVSDVLEAMQELEACVQESQGHYQPVLDSEVRIAGSLGAEKLVFKGPDMKAVQYELDLDSIDSEEFAQAQVMQPEVEVVAQLPTERVAEPPSQENSSANLGLIFEPQNYRNDLKKTQLLSIPSQGVKRSQRGTIEAVFPPNGNVVEAQYNRCGILIQVSVAGVMKLTRSAHTGLWSMSCCDGSQPVNRVNRVAFDRSGNLCYSTEDGVTTVIGIDGSILQK